MSPLAKSGGRRILGRNVGHRIGWIRVVLQFPSNIGPRVTQVLGVLRYAGEVVKVNADEARIAVRSFNR